MKMVVRMECVKIRARRRWVQNDCIGCCFMGDRRDGFKMIALDAASWVIGEMGSK
jgi:hypothetical protein